MATLSYEKDRLEEAVLLIGLRKPPG